MKKASFLILFFVSISLIKGAQTDNPCDSVKAAKDDNVVKIDVDWSKECPQKIISTPKIDDKTSVFLNVKNFNYFHFSLQYAIDDKEIEAYATLEKLWKEIFLFFGNDLQTKFDDISRYDSVNLQNWQIKIETEIDEINKTQRFISDRSLGLAVYEDSFAQIVLFWWRTMRESQANMLRYLDTIKSKVGLNNHDIEIVQEQKNKRDIEKSNLSNIAKAAYIAANEINHIDIFEKFEQRHNDIIQKIDQFIKAAEYAITGQAKNLGKKKSGTIRSITITAIDGMQIPVKDTKPRTIEFFVESTLPVAFHIGYAYEDVKGIEFEKISNLNGTDFFALSKNDDATNDFVTFLSFEPLKIAKEFGLLATIGTGLKTPGEKFFAGISARISLKQLPQIFLSLGGVNTEIVEGEDKIDEKIAEALHFKEIYQMIHKTKTWKFFLGLSFSFF